MKTRNGYKDCPIFSYFFLSFTIKVPPEVAPSGHNADLNASTGVGTSATSPVCHEEVEMRAALQFLMRHMVKRAVMRSPIKRALGLADLERAQAMIYKLVVNGLLEEPSGGKAKLGENVYKFDNYCVEQVYYREIPIIYTACVWITGMLLAFCVLTHHSNLP